MANYYSTTLQKGSQGDETKKWQEYLNTLGYGLAVDGDFGDKTDAATRDYQQKNGLTVDGIVGAKTWGQAGFTDVNTPTTTPSTTSSFQYTPFEYMDFAESDETKGAKDSLSNANDALANLGDFEWDRQGEYDNLYKEYENRPDFSYNFNEDALYQQYKDKYIQQGKMAMADAMGQASAMTGGYGNSYAQVVGNQAYQAQLNNLNDIIPDLYQMAYSKYNQEGQDLLNAISMLKGERDFAYGMHNDQYTKLAADRGYWSDMYNNLYTRDYNQYSSDRELAQTQHNTEEGYKYQTERDAIADAQWQADFDEAKRQFESNMSFAREQYEESKKASSGGSGGSNSGGALQHVASMSSAELVETMQSYSLEGDNTGLAAFLDDCVASGRLSQDQADEYYTKYRKSDPSNKTDTSVDKVTSYTNRVGIGSGGHFTMTDMKS